MHESKVFQDFRRSWIRKNSGRRWHKRLNSWEFSYEKSFTALPAAAAKTEQANRHRIKIDR